MVNVSLALPIFGIMKKGSKFYFLGPGGLFFEEYLRVLWAMLRRSKVVVIRGCGNSLFLWDKISQILRKVNLVCLKNEVNI